MNRSRVLEWIARGAAATIVLAGILDPAVTVSRATKPVISIVSTDTARFAATVRKVEQAVSGAGISVVGSLPEAAAQIVVGSRVSPAMLVRDIPTYVVATGTRGGVHAEAITVPPTAPLDTRIPVTVLLSRAQATGTNTETDTVRAIVELREDGLPLARTVVALTPAQRLQVPLHFTPSRAGAHRLTVSLIEQGDSLTWTRDIVTGPSRWQVLFHDQRPSWLSTFVRRAIASDERFRVSSRIVTSTNVSRTTPGAARSLAALDGGPLPDVLVIGAPELLSRSDMATLEHLMAERGLSVVLLPDHPPPAQAPVSALWRAATWQLLTPLPSNVPREVASIEDRAVVHGPPEMPEPQSTPTPAASRGLLAGSVGAPFPFPVDAEPLALTARSVTPRSGSTAVIAPRDGPRLEASLPVIWRLPIGRGELLVSGAFDAWRYRDRNTTDGSSFQDTWQELLAQAAQRRLPAISIEPEAPKEGPSNAPASSVVRTQGQRARPTVSLARGTGPVSNSPEGSDRQPVSLLPTIVPGAWRAIWSSTPGPAEPATVQASNGSDTARAPLRVGLGLPDTPIEQLEMVVRRTGGRILSPTHLDSLPRLITTALGERRQPAPWHPMRSALWIVPLALAFGGEWWLRRRRGLP